MREFFMGNFSGNTPRLWLIEERGFFWPPITPKRGKYEGVGGGLDVRVCPPQQDGRGSCNLDETDEISEGGMTAGNDGQLQGFG